MNKKTLKIGFWVDPDDPETSHLPHPREFVDQSWDPDQRRLIIDYLKNGDSSIVQKGYSWCRFGCGTKGREMGSKTMTDGVYVWPEGYVHYIEKHNVKPSEEFLEHVRAKLREQSEQDSNNK